MLVQCDFDGTITRNNLSTLLRESFARGDWRGIDARYLRGELTVERSNALQYALIREPREKLQTFVCEHIDLRPGFSNFVTYCRREGISFVIVSSGLDFYIEPVLARMGLPDLELHCGQATFGEDGIAVRYVDPEGKVIDSGFKVSYLTWLRERDSTVIYLGDGNSDVEAARQADHVFATGVLRHLLEAQSVPATPFADFCDVLRQVQRLRRA
jgi:2-hydroxy-3-keto-5-methylthiopentenyl-1-phosphate phosphatase